MRDFAHALERVWLAQGVVCQTLPLARPASPGAGLLAQLQALALDRQKPLAQLRVLLHFSGYGYAPRGLCFWLLHELQTLRRCAGPGLRVVLVFHELFASGRPWQTAFWLGAAQARVARGLVRLADALWTNTEAHARWLGDVKRLPLGQLPVFSNVGEPALLPAWAQREPVLVVFGSHSTRMRALRALQRQPAVLLQLGVQRVLEVGAGAPCAVALPGCELHFAGHVEAPALSALLLRSRYGLIEYPAQHMAKSSVLAAYAAHGNLVINLAPYGADCDGLVAGRQHWGSGAVAGGAGDAAAEERSAQALHAWYSGHALARQAQALLGLLDARRTTLS